MKRTKDVYKSLTAALAISLSLVLPAELCLLSPPPPLRAAEKSERETKESKEAVPSKTENSTESSTEKTASEQRKTAEAAGKTAAPAASGEAKEAGAGEMRAPENDDAEIKKDPMLGEKTLEEAGKGLTLAAENEEAALFYDPATALVRLYNKKKKLCLDNKCLNGLKGNNLTKALQRSDFQITLLKDIRTLGSQSENNFDLSISLKQFEAKKIEGGLRFIFTLGAQGELSAEDLPVSISSEKMSKVLKKLSKNERKQLTKVFREFKDRYTRRTDQTLSQLQLKLFHKLLYEKGKYTKEDLAEDNAKFGTEEKKKGGSLKMELPVDYVLDGQDLLVRVPLKEMKITPEQLLPYRLKLLPYSMVGNEAETGYFLVPDGDGALIHFNNDRKESANYQKRLYGEDLLYETNEKRRATHLSYPVFGMRREAQGALLILEDGKDLADVTVEISGKSDEYNKLNLDYRLIDVDQVRTVGSSTVTQNKYPERLYDGDLVQRYRILDDKESQWLEMARIYADYLEKKGSLPPRAARDVTGEESSILLSFFGVMPKKDFFLGVPYASEEALTSYNEAEEIYRQTEKGLAEKGLPTKVDVTYLAETPGGLFPAKLTPFRTDGALGTAEQKEALRKLVAENGAVFSTALAMNEVSSLRGFRAPEEISRSLSGEYQRRRIADAREQRLDIRDNSPYLVSPRALRSYCAEVAASLAGTSDRLTVLDLGQMPVPDYKREATVLRHEAMQTEAEALGACEQALPLTLNQPADYALRPTADITGLSTEAEKHRLFDAEVPFVSSLFRGRLKTSLERFDPNLGEGIERYILHAMETGALPQFLLMKKRGIELEHSDYESLLAANYDLRRGDVELASEARALYLKELDGSRLEQAELFGDGSLRAYRYSNGKTLWLNYGEQSVGSGETQLAGLSYLFTDGAKSAALTRAAQEENRRHEKAVAEKDAAEEKAKESPDKAPDGGAKTAESATSGEAATQATTEKSTDRSGGKPSGSSQDKKGGSQ